MSITYAAPVEDALVAAALAKAALQSTREQLRRLHKSLRWANEAKATAQAMCSFPTAWENFWSRTENPPVQIAGA